MPGTTIGEDAGKGGGPPESDCVLCLDVGRYTIYWEESTNLLPNLGRCLTAALVNMSQKPLDFSGTEDKKDTLYFIADVFANKDDLETYRAFCSYAK